MPEMVAAYIRMCAEQEMPARTNAPGDEADAGVGEIYEVQVVDMFGGVFLLSVYALLMPSHGRHLRRRGPARSSRQQIGVGVDLAGLDALRAVEPDRRDQDTGA
jgi:hypothetical protein